MSKRSIRKIKLKLSSQNGNYQCVPQSLSEENESSLLGVVPQEENPKADSTLSVVNSEQDKHETVAISATDLPEKDLILSDSGTKKVPKKVESERELMATNKRRNDDLNEEDVDEFSKALNAVPTKKKKSDEQTYVVKKDQKAIEDSNMLKKLSLSLPEHAKVCVTIGVLKKRSLEDEKAEQMKQKKIEDLKQKGLANLCRTFKISNGMLIKYIIQLIVIDEIYSKNFKEGSDIPKMGKYVLPIPKTEKILRKEKFDKHNSKVDISSIQKWMKDNFRIEDHFEEGIVTIPEDKDLKKLLSFLKRGFLAKQEVSHMK